LNKPTLETIARIERKRDKLVLYILLEAAELDRKLVLILLKILMYNMLMLYPWLGKTKPCSITNLI